MFHFPSRGPAEHLKRADLLLREAHLAPTEHQVLAEHHAALAEMYTQRARRLEREIHAARTIDCTSAESGLTDPKIRHYPFHKSEGAEIR